MMRRAMVSMALLAGTLLAGCTQTSRDNSEPIGPDPSGQKYLLAQEPVGAKSVIEVRQNGKDGDEVVVVGRIGDKGDPWVEGRAAFVIADTSFEPCTVCEEAYCEADDKEFSRGRVSVKVVDESGQVVAKDARSLLGLKQLNTVVIKGKVKQEGETFAILASALYVRPEAKK
jgi:hypothetical protein